MREWCQPITLLASLLAIFLRHLRTLNTASGLKGSPNRSRRPAASMADYYHTSREHVKKLKSMQDNAARRAERRTELAGISVSPHISLRQAQQQLCHALVFALLYGPLLDAYFKRCPVKNPQHHCYTTWHPTQKLHGKMWYPLLVSILHMLEGVVSQR